MISILIHASGVACFGYALYYDLFHVHLPPHLAGSATFAAMQAFPGKWKFLTVWDIVSDNLQKKSFILTLMDLDF